MCTSEKCYEKGRTLFSRYDVIKRMGGGAKTTRGQRPPAAALKDNQKGRHLDGSTVELCRRPLPAYWHQCHTMHFS